MPLQYSSTQVGFPNPQSDTRMRSTPGGFQWGTRSQFHTQQLTPFSRSRYYQLQFLKSSLQSNRHQTAESLANPESCKFNELLFSTLKVFPYFTIVIDTSGAEADGYFSTMYFCNESPGANSGRDASRVKPLIMITNWSGAAGETGRSCGPAAPLKYPPPVAESQAPLA